MFGLIRRISGSVLPRADRPWDDDATSNAPQIGRKRKLSSGSISENPRSLSKKSKPLAEEEETPVAVISDADKSANAEPQSSSPPAQPVKEVTSGVARVELEGSGAEESVPLPTQDDAEVEELQEKTTSSEPQDAPPHASEESEPSSESSVSKDVPPKEQDGPQENGTTQEDPSPRAPEEPLVASGPKVVSSPPTSRRIKRLPKTRKAPVEAPLQTASEEQESQ